jgi:uncharacterized protein with FMN-binding domain
MKRLILTVTGTAAGLAALLSFKTQTHPLTNTAPMPSAGSASTPSGTSSTAAANGASTSTGSAPKTYTGQAVTTRYGVVQVKATVANARITDVAFVQLTAFDQHSQQINDFAGPQLLQETLKNQTAQVDSISGATYTSDGYRESMQSALDQAGLK